MRKTPTWYGNAYDAGSEYTCDTVIGLDQKKQYLSSYHTFGLSLFLVTFCRTGFMVLLLPSKNYVLGGRPGLSKQNPKTEILASCVRMPIMYKISPPPSIQRTSWAFLRESKTYCFAPVTTNGNTSRVKIALISS
jgi:hypothetical protein